MYLPVVERAGPDFAGACAAIGAAIRQAAPATAAANAPTECHGLAIGDPSRCAPANVESSGRSYARWTVRLQPGRSGPPPAPASTRSPGRLPSGGLRGWSRNRALQGASTIGDV